MIRIASVFLLLLPLVSLALGCRYAAGQIPSGKKLVFEHVFGVNSSYPGTSPLIYVLTDNQSPLPEWFPQGLEWKQPIDYSRYLVVIAFHGWRPSADKGLLITDIWQDADIVYLRAQFQTFPGAIHAEETSGAQIVKVSKAGMRRFGQLTFVLLDDYGKERARTTAVVSPPK